MASRGTLTISRVAGTLLTSCFLVFAVGGPLFTARNGMAGQPAPSFAYLVLERGFVMAAVVTANGLLLFAKFVGGPHGDALIPARLAAASYAIATALLLVAEAGLPRSGRFPYALVVAYWSWPSSPRPPSARYSSGRDPCRRGSVGPQSPGMSPGWLSCRSPPPPTSTSRCCTTPSPS